MHVYVSICIYLYLSVSICIYLSIYLSIHLCMYVCMYRCMYGCMYGCMYACMYVHVYICIGTYRLGALISPMRHVCGSLELEMQTLVFFFAVTIRTFLSIVIRFDNSIFDGRFLLFRSV